MICATGLSVFFARLRADVTFPVMMLSRIILMKLGSIFEAFLIAINLSKKTKIAATNKRYKGYISQPPLSNKLHKVIFSGVCAAAVTSLEVVSEICNKIPILFIL